MATKIGNINTGGPTGPTGPSGSTGATGATGPAGGGGGSTAIRTSLPSAVVATFPTSETVRTVSVPASQCLHFIWTLGLKVSAVGTEALLLLGGTSIRTAGTSIMGGGGWIGSSPTIDVTGTILGVDSVQEFTVAALAMNEDVVAQDCVFTLIAGAAAGTASIEWDDFVYWIA